MSERVLEVKEHVESLKVAVRSLQASLTEAKLYAEAGNRGAWGEYNDLKKRWQNAVNELGAAKLELQRLSGTTGHDPRWMLLRSAYVVLTRLDEAGVDIGDDGQQLLADIEFHVPTAKLKEAIDASAEAGR